MKRRIREDRMLMERIAARDPVAAETLFDRHGDEIHAYLARRLAPDDAEDRLQETFARALRSASRWSGDSEIRSWLYGIARNVLRERQRDRLDPRSFVDGPDTGPGPLSLVIEREANARLLAALEALPDDQAIVLELHRVDGLEHEEIAAVLGIRPATSRKRLQRALAVLRRQIVARGSARRPRHRSFDSWRRSLQKRVLPLDSAS